MPYYWAYDSRRCRFGSMLTPEQRTEFDERGFVLIPSAFTAAEASAMEDLVWAHVEAREGVIRGDPSTWNLTMVVGLGHLKAAPAFAAIGSPVTVAALDDVLGLFPTDIHFFGTRGRPPRRCCCSARTGSAATSSAAPSTAAASRCRSG